MQTPFPLAAGDLDWIAIDHPDTLTSLWSMAQDLIKLDRAT